MSPIEYIYSLLNCQEQSSLITTRGRINLRAPFHTNAHQVLLLLRPILCLTCCVVPPENKRTDKEFNLITMHTKSIHLLLLLCVIEIGCPHAMAILNQSNRCSGCLAAADALRGEQEPRQAGSSRRVSLTLHCTIRGGRQAGRASALADSIWRKDYLCADIPKLIRLWIIPGYRFWSGESRPISKQYREYRRWCQWTGFLIPQPRCYQRDIIRLFCGLCRCIDRNGVIHRRWIKTKLFL